MATKLSDDLPEALREIRIIPLFVMRLDVRPLQIVGKTPGVYRRVGVVPGGSFEGERLSGEVLEGAMTGRRSAAMAAQAWMCGLSSKRRTPRSSACPIPAYGTDRPTSWRASKRANRSILKHIMSVSPHASRRQPHPMRGSITSSPSELAIAVPMGRSTAFLKCFEQGPDGAVG
jgi:hypothetical protein